MTVAVNPKVLRAARETRCLNEQRAASLLKWTQDKLALVESSEEIEEADLERMAKAYKLPLPTLLMPEPLDPRRYGPRPIADLRLHDGKKLEPFSIGTQEKVEAAYELLELMVEANDIMPKPDIPHFKLSDKAAEAAAKERARIGLSFDVQFGLVTDKDAFLRWREVVESTGIIVHKMKLPEESVRGFAIYHEGFGLIAIDSDEDYRPRVFTLLHEYAHLLLRKSGISDQNRKVPIERWCNQFAAHFLMPEAIFVEQYKGLFPNAKAANEFQVNRMSVRFRTSKQSAALRFEETGLAPVGFYEELKKKWAKGKYKEKSGGFGPSDSIETELGRYGTTHIRAICTALQNGVIDKVEAQYALDVQQAHFPALMAAARQRQRTYGGGAR